jgi:16S rRNA G527 N7-methylase RsmG
VRNDLEVVLIESRRRRAMFLNNAVRDLRLEGIHVHEGRIENLPSELNGSFDAAVMRCAGDIEEMIPAAAVLVADSGVVVGIRPAKASAVVRWRMGHGSGSTERDLSAIREIHQA